MRNMIVELSLILTLIWNSGLCNVCLGKIFDLNTTRKLIKEILKLEISALQLLRFCEESTVKHLLFAVSIFRGLMKMTCWRNLILAFMINHGSR